MVFGTQALGLIIGPLIALALLGSGASDDVAWRVLLARGAVPAAAVIYLRCRMPESPRYRVHVAERAGRPHPQAGLRAFLTSRRWLITLAGTAGCWFLLDYAYYGNTISTPQILSLISPHASTMTKIALQLAGFAVMALCFLVIAAVPGMTTAVVPFMLRRP
jgi:MFS transporter, PHS family, inorganic phosphate transporter